MSKSKKIQDIKKMYKEGYTQADIAKKYECSRQYIHSVIHDIKQPPEKRKVNNKRYYEKHKERMLKQEKEWRDNHPEKLEEYKLKAKKKRRMLREKQKASLQKGEKIHE